MDGSLRFRLQRFAALTPLKPDLPTTEIAFGVGDVWISFRQMSNTTTPKVLMGAQVFFDAESIDGLNDPNVVAARERAELGISEALPILCAMVGAGYALESCSPFFAIDWPSDSDGKARVGGDWVIRQMPIVPQINILQMKIEEAAACLEERSIGAKLLAQGLCTTHPIGRFLSFCQLFENAFRTPFEQLTEILSEFLQGNNLDYSADEVSVWVDTRGAAAHGDLKKARMIADEHAVRQFLDRMQQAAYDALMNKLNWHQKDAARREAWHPGTASKAKLGELVFVAGKPTNFRLRPMDPFTNWPVASDCRLEKSGDAVMPSVNVQMPMQLEVRPGPLEPEIGIL